VAEISADVQLPKLAPRRNKFATGFHQSDSLDTGKLSGSIFFCFEYSTGKIAV